MSCITTQFFHCIFLIFTTAHFPVITDTKMADCIYFSHIGEGVGRGEGGGGVEDIFLPAKFTLNLVYNPLLWKRAWLLVSNNPYPWIFHGLFYTPPGLDFPLSSPHPSPCAEFKCNLQIRYE